MALVVCRVLLGFVGFCWRSFEVFLVFDFVWLLLLRFGVGYGFLVGELCFVVGTWLLGVGYVYSCRLVGLFAWVFCV